MLDYLLIYLLIFFLFKIISLLVIFRYKLNKINLSISIKDKINLKIDLKESKALLSLLKIKL